MSTLPTRIEREAGRRLAASEIVDITAARERALSRMLMLYISTGVVFMLLPGTFLGVWNLLTISSHRAANSVSPAWIQAHGHAQIFGWIGSFILGIGFYSIPKLRRLGSFGSYAGVVRLGAVDFRCCPALARERLSLALARACSTLFGLRVGRLPRLFPYCLGPSRRRFGENLVRRMGLCRDCRLTRAVADIVGQCWPRVLSGVSKYVT